MSIKWVLSKPHLKVSKEFNFEIIIQEEKKEISL